MTEQKRNHILSGPHLWVAEVDEAASTGPSYYYFTTEDRANYFRDRIARYSCEVALCEFDDWRVEKHFADHMPG